MALKVTLQTNDLTLIKHQSSKDQHIQKCTAQSNYIVLKMEAVRVCRPVEISYLFQNEHFNSF